MFSRSRGKPLAFIATMVVVGIVMTCLIIHNGRERKTFFGNLDIESGDRCRFSVSAAWQWTASPPTPPSQSHLAPTFGTHSDFLPGFFVDYAKFTFPPPTRFSQWMSQHFFHATGIPREIPSIFLWSCPIHDFLAGELRFVHGYPEVPWTGTEPGLTQRHFTVDGCPATVAERPIVVEDIPCRYMLLLVYKPDHAFIYSVGGFVEAGSAHWFENEMKEIVASFHVEKVAGRAGVVNGIERGTP